MSEAEEWRGPPVKIRLETNNELMANTMSKSGFDFNTAMYELIDNSVAAKAKEVEVVFWIDPIGQKLIHQIHVSDDGVGFPLDTLATTLAMGAMTGEGINEHGVGLKQAVGYYGGNSIRDGLIGIETYDGEDCYEITGYEDNEVTRRDMKPWGKTGSIVKIDCSAQKTHLSKRLKPLLEMLGVRCGHFIKNDGLVIEVSLVDINTSDVIEGGDHKVVAIFPPYYNPQTETNTHLWRDSVQNITGTVQATLTIGISPEGESGVWQKGIYAGGIDIVQDGRVVIHRAYEPLEGWRKPHPQMNRITGDLVIHTGRLATTPKKDGFQETADYIELKESIAESLRSSNISKLMGLEKEAERYEEKDMRKGLKSFLKTATDPKGNAMWHDVNDEDATDTGLSIDVSALVDGEKWVFEIKKEIFGAPAMNQLIGYMIASGSVKGVVFSPHVLDNAKKQLEYWREALVEDIDIEFWDSEHTQFKTVMNAYVEVKE